MVVVVMLTLLVMVMGMFQLRTRAGIEAIQMGQSIRAFWMAEAGLQDALQRLTLPEYRNYDSYSNSVGNGSYEINVTDISSSTIPYPKTTYTVVSVGRDGGFNRRVQQMLSISQALKPALVLQGDADLSSNSKIDGSVLLLNGEFSTHNHTTEIMEYVYGENVMGGGIYEQAQIPPEVEPPDLDTHFYFSKIDAVHYNTNALPLTLLGGSISGSVTYDADVRYSTALSVAPNTEITTSGDLFFDADTTFNGAVTIYCGGNLSIDRKTALPPGSVVIAREAVNLSAQTTFNQQVRIFSGADITIGSQASFDGGSILYAHGDLVIASGGAISVDDSGKGIMLLANGGIDIRSNLNVFKGVIYANTGPVKIAPNSEIYGAVVALAGLSAGSNVDFHEDYSVFDWDAGEIGISWEDEVITKGIWLELPPL